MSTSLRLQKWGGLKVSLTIDVKGQSVCIPDEERTQTEVWTRV